jgi:hypothetical protein
MMFLNPQTLSAFSAEMAATNAHLAVERPKGIVARALVDDDPEIYGGLVARTQGFARLALDEVNGTVILFASKVADHLRGERDASSVVRPTQEGLQRSYVISALRHRAGGPILPPDRAEHFKDQIRIYCNEMRHHNAGMLTLYGTQIGDQTVFANNYVSYVITPDKQGRCSVRFVAPLRTHHDRENSESLVEAFSRSLIQKSLGTKLSRAQADLVLMEHWQTVSSKLWDNEPLHKGEGAPMHAARLATQLGRYPKDHGLGMLTAMLVAGGFMMAKDAHMVAAAIVGFSVLHAVADVTLKETFGGAVGGFKEGRKRAKAKAIQNYDENEEAVRFYLDPSPENLKKLCAHIDLTRFKPEDFRFLNTQEVRGLLQTHGRFEENLRPSSLRGLAVHGDQRGFTSTAFYPGPRTRVNIYQTGMVTLKHARGDGKIDIFVTDRPKYCLRDGLRLSALYIDQIREGGTGLQHIVYDTHAEAFAEGFTQQSVTYAQMQEILGPRLFATPHSSPTNFVPPIGQRRQRECWASIAHYFDPAQEAAFEQTPLFVP